ncbi:MAG TPA: hypothetical protein VKC54_00885, partial [Patescibacteria group bacterium]|nr:hypothetical protein [Patescibacteria group bacterium]
MYIEFDVSVRLECLPNIPCPFKEHCSLVENRVLGRFAISERIAGYEEVQYRSEISKDLVRGLTLEPCTRTE